MKNFLETFKTWVQKSKTRAVFWLVALVYLPIMVVTSAGAGVSGDESKHFKHGENAYAFLFEGKDNYKKEGNYSVLQNQHYNQSLNVVTYAFIRWFDIEKPYVFMHKVNALVGWLGMLFTGLCVAYLSNYLGGIFTFLLIALSPRFFGHSLNNPTDIPFAVGYIASLYFMLRTFYRFPVIDKKNFIGLGISIGFMMSIRVGGLILFPIVLLYSFLIASNHEGLKSMKNISTYVKHKKWLIYLFGTFVLAYFLGIITWPKALQAPLTQPLESLKVLSNIPLALNQVFEGVKMMASEQPWYYTIKYIGMTVPLVVFAGLILYVIALVNKKERFNVHHFIVVFMFAFPLAYVIYKESTFYGAWRHMMFIYAPLVVLAGLGWASLQKYTNPLVKKTGWSLMGIYLLMTAFWMVKNSPYQYVYYNELVGGVDAANGQYEIDYFFTTTKSAAEWLIENRGDELRKATKENPITIASTSLLHYYFDKKEFPHVRLVYTRYYERNKNKWDYAIFANSYVLPHQLRDKSYPLKGTIHEVKVDNTPVSILVERVSNDDYLGMKAFKENKIDTALKYLTRYHKLDPKAGKVSLTLYQIYLKKRDVNKAATYLEKAAKSMGKDNPMIMFNQANFNKMIGRYQLAIEGYKKLLAKQFQPIFSMYSIAECLHALKDYRNTINVVQQVLKYENRDPRLYELLVSSYQALNNPREAERYRRILEKFRAN